MTEERDPSEDVERDSSEDEEQDSSEDEELSVDTSRLSISMLQIPKVLYCLIFTCFMSR